MEMDQVVILISKIEEIEEDTRVWKVTFQLTNRCFHMIVHINLPTKILR